MRKFISVAMALALALSGCSSFPKSNQDSTVGIGPQDVSVINSTLSFECEKVDKYFYYLYFGIQMKNNSDKTITNDNVNSLKLEAGLLNINDLGRLETTDFAVSQSGIEPGATGLLAFYLNPSPNLEWKSLDITIDGAKVYDQPISLSKSICM